MSAKTESFLIDSGNCPCEGNSLDKLIQPAILVILSHGPLHGYRLVERLADMKMLAGQKPNASGVYRLLNGMEGKQLVLSNWDTSGTGPAKRTFELTTNGENCLRRWIKTLEEYREGISALLRDARKAVS